MGPVQCFEVKILMEALIDRLYSVSWEPVKGRKFSSGPGPLWDETGLIVSHVAEEDMGHEALVAQSWECSASVALRPDPEGDHPRLVPDPEVVVLETLRCPPPGAGQWDGEHVEGRSRPSCPAGGFFRELLMEDAECVS